MMSLNDAEDPHFRKALFDPTQCPADCPRPCEGICPAIAIDQHGVIGDRCYGCGRCLPICPLGLISAQNYVSTPQVAAELIVAAGIDAVEIHTQVGHLEDFRRLWQAIAPVHQRLQLLAISCQDHPDVLLYLEKLLAEIQPLDCELLWQTDGRPMSGDIGKGTIHASIHFAQKLLQSNIPGYVQLAGGTNDHTIHKLKEQDLFKGSQTQGDRPFISGIAFGSYARKQLQPILEPSDGDRPNFLENDPARLWQAVAHARTLINPLKS
jgi:Fe-S-cluster-containing hydrogenase component 2